MKIMILATALLSFVCAAYTQPQSLSDMGLEKLTNIFLTIDDFQDLAIRGVMDARIEPEKLAKALHSDESKPEAQDPGGHWGPIVEGFRLSLRFEKTEYAKGEQILATILLRNVVQTNLYYRGWLSQWEFPFSVIDPLNNLMPDVDPQEPPGMGAKRRLVYPRTQKRFTFRLDDHFNFETPGEYSVSVKGRVLKLAGEGLANIESATARFKLVPARVESGTNAPLNPPKK